MLNLEHYLALRARPDEPVAMLQQWRNLLFLHYSCDPDEIQAILPKGLTVDTFEGRAWVGLVPFRMQDVRPRQIPPLPGCTAFPETNVRTYVHHAGGGPGIWFFSLDAANPLAVRWARIFFALPYFEAVMSVTRSESVVRYRSARVRPPFGGTEITASIGEEMGEAEPGTLEFFLIERYLLYAMRRGQLHSGRVHHRPYPLRAASLTSERQNLLQAQGLAPCPWEHTIFSDGVNVEVFGIKPVH